MGAQSTRLVLEMHKHYFLAKPGKNKSKIVLQVELLGIYTRTWWVAADIYEHIRSPTR